MVESKVLIGIVTGEYARRADFYDYYNLLTKPPNCVVLMCHDRSPARGRNIIIEQAIENNCTHILFIDDDQTYKPEALTQLLAHDKDIVSGLYLSRAYPHQPLIFDYADDEGRCLYSYLLETDKGLKKIVAAGFGFVLMKTEFLKKMERPWVRLGELDNQEWCDDIGFFNRARKYTEDIYCDMDCLVGHMGTMIIWPSRNEKGEWLTGYDTNGKGMIHTPQVHPEVTVK